MTRVTPSTGLPNGKKADHLCRHDGCGRWGAWGYDAGEGVIGWWCLEHRPNEDPVRPAADESWVSDGNEG